MLETVKQILMRRDGLSPAEADALIAEARKSLNHLIEDGDFIGAENICYDYFGLEPDYLEELF